jgi:hypothetical protein
MATAGNIILNLGRTPTGRYVVRPQGRLFAAAKEEDPMKTASGLMTILKQAKGVADMVAPFLSQEYQPPLQQGEIAAQQLKAAQEAAQQAKAQAADIGAQPLPLAPGLGSTQQQLQQSLGVTPGAGLGPSVLQLAPDVAAQLPQAPLPPVGVGSMPDPGKFGFESPVPGMTLGGPSEQQYLAAEQLAKTGQAVAAAEQAVAESPQALPTFNTIADAETAIRSALMLGDFQTANRMLAGLRYSALTDIPLATEIGEIPAAQRRQKAIADMMKRLRMPSELTPVRAELQRGRQQASLLAIEARNKATEERREAVAAANARQKAEIEARKAAAKAAAKAKRDLQTDLYDRKIELEKEKQKGRRRQVGTRYYYQKRMFNLTKGTATQEQYNKEIRKSEAATKRARTFLENYGAKLPKRPVKQANEKPVDFKRKVDTWEKQTKEFKKQLQLFNYNRLLNARARYIRDWTLEKQNKGKKIPQDILTGDIPNEYYLPDVKFMQGPQGTPPTNQGGSGGATTSTPSSPPNVVDETLNILNAK